MKANYFILVLFFLGFSKVYSQSNWATTAPMGNGINNVHVLYFDSLTNYLYAGGAFNSANNVQSYSIAKFNGSDWDSLKNDLEAGWIREITRYSNKLIIGGSLQPDYCPYSDLIYWDGDTFKDLAPAFAIDGGIYGMSILDGKLFLLGQFNHVNGIQAQGILVWDGNTITNPYPPIPGDGFFIVKDAAIFQGNLYVGGNFYGSPGIKDIAKWNGQEWTSVGGGLFGGFSGVSDLQVFQGSLYVGGSFSKCENDSNPGNYIARWDGSQWHEVGGGVDGNSHCNNAYVFSMKVHNGLLYLCGKFERAGEIPAPGLVTWNGEQWCAFGGEFEQGITEFNFWGDSMFAVTWGILDGFESNGVVYWKGGDFRDTCSILYPNAIEAQPSHSSLILSPNPASTSFTVNSTSKQAELYDCYGKILFAINLQKGKAEVDVSKLPPGLYFLKTNKGEVGKVVVER
jgi:hypothetical protein